MQYVNLILFLRSYSTEIGCKRHWVISAQALAVFDGVITKGSTGCVVLFIRMVTALTFCTCARKADTVMMWPGRLPASSMRLQYNHCRGQPFKSSSCSSAALIAGSSSYSNATMTAMS